MAELKKARTMEDLVAERRASSPEYNRVYQENQAAHELRKALIAARLQAGLTQQELADRMGIAQANVARIESGRTDLRLSTIVRVATATGVEISITTKPVRATISTEPVPATSVHMAKAS